MQVRNRIYEFASLDTLPADFEREVERSDDDAVLFPFDAADIHMALAQPA